MPNLPKKLEDCTWLLKYLSPEDFMEIKLSEAIPISLKSERINFQSWISELVSREENNFSEILLFDQNGEKIGRVGEIHYPPKPTVWWRKNPKPHIGFNPEETVREAIIRVLSEQKDWAWYILDKQSNTLYYF